MWLAPALAIAAACPGGPGPDDDDASPAEPVVDLSHGDEVALRLLQVIDLRYLVHGNELGFLVADDACPVEDGEDRWVGGCTAESGYTFEGTMIRQEGAMGVVDYEGSGWSVRGHGGPFARLLLDGTVEYHESFDGDGASVRGTMEAVSKEEVAEMRDWSATGSFDFESEWPEEPPEPHQYLADLEDPDGAAWEADVLFLELDGFCGEPAEGSHAFLSSGGHEAELLLVEDPDPCDRCWPWTLDGAAMSEQACIDF